jgi:hypothetical protein
MTTIIKQLFDKGYSVSIDNGKLNISTSNGREIPSQWLTDYSNRVASEVAQLLNQSIYSYSHYKTGIFCRGVAPGVMVTFIDLYTREDAFAIFNATLKRQRNTKLAKAGGALRKGVFNIGTRSALYKLWFKLGLDLPRRPSELYKSMGKLKSLYLTGENSNSTKLANNTIRPFSCDSKVIIEILSGNSVASQWQSGGKVVARTGGNNMRQNPAVRSGVNNTSETPLSRWIGVNPNCVSQQLSVNKSKGHETACPANQEQSNKVMTNRVSSITTITNNKKLPEEQTNDDWWSDYDSV